MKLNAALLYLCVVFSWAWGCGDKNIYQRYENNDSLHQASVHMEAGEFKEAQILLENFINDTPDHGPGRSLLAASLAAQAGITIKSFILNAMKNTGGSTNSPSNQLLELIPEYTAIKSEFLKLALKHMTFIPAEKKTKDMDLQEGLFTFIYIFMRIKFLKNNPQELISLTIQDAEILLASLTSATVLVAKASGGGEVASKIQEASNAITQKEGANAAEKIAQYVNSNSL